MRRVLFTVLLLASSAFATIGTPVCVVGASSGGANPYTVSGLASSSSGDLIYVLAATTNASTVSSITDNQSQTYLRAKTQNGGASFGGAEVWYKYNSAAGVTQASITPSGFTATFAIVCKVSGILTASDPLDLTAGSTSAFTGVTSWSSGNSAGSAAQASEIFVGVVETSSPQAGSTIAAGATYTAIGNDTGKSYFGEYMILTTASGQYAADGTYSPNSGTAYDVAMASFKGAGGVVAKPCTITLLGAGPC